MNFRSISLLLALVVLTGLVALMWQLGDSPGGGPATMPRVEEGQERLAAEAPDLSERAPERAEPAAERRTPAAQPTPEPAAPTGGADRIELAGTLVFPEGTPLDETAEVVLSVPDERESEDWFAFSDPWKEIDRVAVAADGGFRLHLPETASRVLVDLEGRYLYLEGSVILENPGEAKPLRIEPELGGVLQLRFVASSSSAYDVRDVVGKELRVPHRPATGAFGGWPTIPATIGDDLTVELTALDPGDRYGVEGDLSPFVSPRCDGIRVRPGERTVVEIELVDGWVLGGVVVDEQGEPLEGADLRVECPYETQDGGRGTRNLFAESDADGRFQLSGVPPSMASISARLDGYLRVELAAEDLGGDAARRGLRIVLGSGSLIEGIVALADGRPVTGASVRLRIAGQNPKYYPGTRATTDEAGRFRFTGLATGGDYELDAKARLDEAALAPEHPIVTAVDRRADGIDWTAAARTIASGVVDAKLSLVEPPGLEGVVVDAGGAPVVDFRIEAETDRGMGTGPFGDRIFSADHSKRFQSADGTFRWAELPVGKWKVAVEADGYLPSRPTRVEVPVGTGPVRFVLGAGATVSGVVLDPGGNPIAGATVNPALITGRARMSSGNLRGSTDAEGRFLLTGVTAGENELTAWADGFAPSEPVVVDLTTGQDLTGVELRLAVGGYLSIDVFGDDGTPEAYAMVSVRGGPFSFGGRGETDAKGHYEHGPVRAGEFRVIAHVEEGKRRLEETVTVVDGETVHLTLGGERRAAVVVRGRVTSGGEPLAGAVVHLRPAEHENADERTETDADGRFSVGLIGGGRVRFQVYGGGGGRFQLFEETLPEEGTSEVAFDLPTGGLRGRVIREEGGELSFWLQIVVERIREEGTAWAGGDVSVLRVDHETGTWSCLHLEPGHYRAVAAEDPRMGGGFEESPAAPAVIEDIIVEAGRVTEGVDLVLGAPGAVEGVVRGPEGRPIAEAYLLARDARGRLFHPGYAGAGSGGSFTLSGLPAGRVTIEAVAEGLATPAPVPVDVTPGEVVRQDLDLVPATVVTVKLEGLSGDASGIVLRLRDAAGREHAGERGGSAGWLHAANRTERRFGPLPPGRWLAAVTLPDGRDVEVAFELAGERERTIVLECAR